MRNLSSLALSAGVAAAGLLGSLPTSSAQETQLITRTASGWRYNQSGANLGTAWRANETGTGWMTGQGAFAGGEDQTVYPTWIYGTSLTAPNAGGPITTYYRYSFNFSGNPAGVTLVCSNVIDDGAVFYLNGAECGRVRLTGTVTSTTLATASDPEGSTLVTNLNPATLQAGANVLAVEVHQSAANSSDVVFALSLTAITASQIVITDQPEDTVVTRGFPLMLSVTVTGSNPQYQWYKDGARRAGATSATLTIPNAQPSDAGAYYVVITNALNVVTSTVVNVSVSDDSTGPQLVFAYAETPTTNVIVLNFDEAVLRATATNIANYTVSRLGTNPTTLTVTNVLHNASQVQIRLAAGLAAGATHAVTVSNVRDNSANTNLIAPNSRIGVAVYNRAVGFAQNWKSWNVSGYFFGACPQYPPNTWKDRTYNDSDDTCWTEGSGVFFTDIGPPPVPALLCGAATGDQLTYITGGGLTYYFRTRFNALTNNGRARIRLRYVIDDGAVVYLNGVEIHRVRLPAGTILPTTGATPTEPSCQTTADIAVTNLLTGTNLLCVEVHEQAGDPGDLERDAYFGLELTAAIQPELPGPRVNITSPSSGETVTNTTPLTIMATATNTGGGTITRVEFFRGTTSLGVDTIAPYSVTWASPTIGNHSLTAVATDNTGAAATSAPVPITVVPGGTTNRPVLRIVRSANGTQAILSWAGTATLEVTTNLLGVNNTPWTTVQGASNPFTTSVDGQRRFYRLRVQ